MRRFAALFLLVAVASMFLSLASESAEARAKRKKPRRRAATHTTAVTSEPDSADAPTPPDVVIPRRLLVLGFGGAGVLACHQYGGNRTIARMNVPLSMRHIAHRHRTPSRSRVSRAG